MPDKEYLCALLRYTLAKHRLWSDELGYELPRNWETHGDFVLFPIYTFRSRIWKLVGDEIWKIVCKELHCKRIGRKNGWIMASDEMRRPNVEILYGDDGWITKKENGILYSWDVEKVMFSSGNLSEKQRIGSWDCRGKVVVDLFAGIGYFTLSYLMHAQADFVYAIEMNPDSVSALKFNLEQNKISPTRYSIIQGDNRKVTPVNVADHVNLGLLPSCETSYIAACKALNKRRGGILHIHANVITTPPGKKDEQVPVDVHCKCGLQLETTGPFYIGDDDDYGESSAKPLDYNFKNTPNAQNGAKIEKNGKNGANMPKKDDDAIQTPSKSSLKKQKRRALAVAAAKYAQKIAWGDKAPNFDEKDTIGVNSGEIDENGVNSDKIDENGTNGVNSDKVDDDNANGVNFGIFDDDETSGDSCAQNDASGDNSSENSISGENSSENGTGGENSSENSISGENSSENSTSGENSSENSISGENSSENSTSGENSSENSISGENSSENSTSGENSSENGAIGQNFAQNDENGAIGENLAQNAENVDFSAPNDGNVGSGDVCQNDENGTISPIAKKKRKNKKKSKKSQIYVVNGDEGVGMNENKMGKFDEIWGIDGPTNCESCLIDLDEVCGETSENIPIDSMCVQLTKNCTIDAHSAHIEQNNTFKIDGKIDENSPVDVNVDEMPQKKKKKKKKKKSKKSKKDEKIEEEKVEVKIEEKKEESIQNTVKFACGCKKGHFETESLKELYLRNWTKWGDLTAGHISDIFNYVMDENWTVEVLSLTKVKSYAPHIHHLVLDLKCKFKSKRRR